MATEGMRGGMGPLASRLGLGLAALGRPGYINIGHARDLAGEYDAATMEARAHEVLDAAHGGGVRYFDVARSYGKAEDFLASWLRMRDVARGSVTVASKWGYAYTARWRVDAEIHEVKDHSLAQLERQLAESRARLGSHLALYQIHSVTPDSHVLDDDRVIARLAALGADGLLIGLTLSGPSQGEVLARALDVHHESNRVFDSVQATWNLLERSAEPRLDEAHRAGLSVIVKETLANGRLTERNVSTAFESRLGLLRREAARVGTTIDALALAAILARPWASIALSGAATVAQLQSNLAAAAVAWSDETEERLRPLMMDSSSYWRERSTLRWN